MRTPREEDTRSLELEAYRWLRDHGNRYTRPDSTADTLVGLRRAYLTARRTWPVLRRKLQTPGPALAQLWGHEMPSATLAYWRARAGHRAPQDVCDIVARQILAADRHDRRERWDVEITDGRPHYASRGNGVGMSSP